MCKNAYEKLSESTKKIMIFCRLKELKSLDGICISQRFCPDKDKYIAFNQKKNCKKYSE